jgi:hypothetical protein
VPSFEDSAIREIQIAERNHDFRVSEDCLLSFETQYRIRCFRERLTIDIPGEIEAICKSLFSRQCTLSTVEPEIERLKFVERSELCADEDFR